MPAAPSPFSLDEHAVYRHWRAAKLDACGMPSALPIANLGSITEAERDGVQRSCQSRNFCLFRAAEQPADTAQALHAFGRRLGLLDLDQNLCAEEDGITAITVRATGTDHVYIPYTNRPLGWHTDGYYNDGRSQVHAWLLFCQQPAADGGTNELLDHEVAYIRLRDENPEWIRALMADDAFTIPANTERGQQIRPDHSGPVFAVSPLDGSLHMRYSARQRNVVWKDDPATHEAAAFLLDLFRRGDDQILRYRLQAGEGLISNNILHRRDGFRDDPDPGRQRLVYRARYHHRVPAPKEY